MQQKTQWWIQTLEAKDYPKTVRACMLADELGAFVLAGDLGVNKLKTFAHCRGGFNELGTIIHSRVSTFKWNSSLTRGCQCQWTSLFNVSMKYGQAVSSSYLEYAWSLRPAMLPMDGRSNGNNTVCDLRLQAARMSVSAQLRHEF